jgi:hypothetical protein
MNELEKKVQEIAQKDEERIATEVIIMLFSDCTIEQLKKLGEYDAFLRMAKNFINSNTQDDVNLFVKHNTIFKLLKSL